MPACLSRGGLLILPVVDDYSYGCHNTSDPAGARAQPRERSRHMFKKLVIFAGALLIVLAVACGSDKEPSSEKDQGDATAVATKAVATKAAATKAAPTREATKEADGGDSAGALEPLSFLTSGMFGGEAEGAVLGTADPDLASLLITSGDLPPSFNAAGGDMGFSMDLPEGTTRMAMRTFMQGDPNASEMAPTVVSAAMAMPPAALDEFDSQLAELDRMSIEEIQEAMGGASMLGIEFKEFDVEKVSLGDGGFSMHMVMDMSGLVEGLGELAEEGMGDFPTGFAFDMYIFRQGDNVLMAMTMLSEGQGSPVDAASLAEIMESETQ